MKTVGKLTGAAVIVFALLQCIRPAIPSQPAAADIQAPPEVRHILETHCYACHSELVKEPLPGCCERCRPPRVENQRGSAS